MVRSWEFGHEDLLIFDIEVYDGQDTAYFLEKAPRLLLSKSILSLLILKSSPNIARRL